MIRVGEDLRHVVAAAPQKPFQGQLERVGTRSPMSCPHDPQRHHFTLPAHLQGAVRLDWLARGSVVLLTW